MLRVWRLTDNDIWAATSLDEAIEDYLTTCGRDCVGNVHESPHELTEQEMREFTLFEEDGDPSGDTLYDVAADMRVPGMVICRD